MNDPYNLKSAAKYLVQLAQDPLAPRRRPRIKIDALRECKDELLEAHANGMSVRRMSILLRQRNIEISAPHLARALKLFIQEERRFQAALGGAAHGPAPESPPSKLAVMRLAEGTRRPPAREKTAGAKPSSPPPPKPEAKTPAVYQVAERPALRAREEAFTKELQRMRRLIRPGYLPGAPAQYSPSRKQPGRAAPARKPGKNAKAPEAASQNTREDEFAKERRHARRQGSQKTPASGAGGREKQPPAPGR